MKMKKKKFEELEITPIASSVNVVLIQNGEPIGMVTKFKLIVKSNASIMKARYTKYGVTYKSFVKNISKSADDRLIIELF